MNTPWGVSQHQHTIIDGVYEVDTAGHGGILVSTAVAPSLLSQEAIDNGELWGQWYAYEEDCDWALFAYEQPELYAAARNQQGCTPRTAEETKQNARESLALFHPGYLAEVEKEASHAEVEAVEQL